MNRSDLLLGVRVVIMMVTLVVGAVLVWSFVVAPLRARQADLAGDVTSAESQLEAMERQTEVVPPRSLGEFDAWQNSRDALLGQLGPESELPLFVEALVRLSEAQGIEAFVETAGAFSVSTAAPQERQRSEVERVIGAMAGVRRVALRVTAFGDYAAIGRFIGQMGRLGWVTELGGVEMQREFPDVAARIRVAVYFRTSRVGSSNGDAQRGSNGGQPLYGPGGGSHG